MTHSVDALVPRVQVESARVRWGALWFAVLMAGLWVDPRSVTALLAALAALAGWQSGRDVVERTLGASMAAVVVVATGFDVQAGGVVLVAAVVGSFVVALATPGRGGALSRCSALMATWFPAALAALSVVVTVDYELGAAVILLWVVSMYDAGSYLVGAGSTSRWVGPLAGVIAAAAVVHTSVQLAIPPLEPATAWRFAALVVVTLPLGPMVVSFLGLRGWAPRRLDSLVVTGPVWAWSIGVVT